MPESEWSGVDWLPWRHFARAQEKTESLKVNPSSQQQKFNLEIITLFILSHLQTPVQCVCLRFLDVAATKVAMGKHKQTHWSLKI